MLLVDPLTDWFLCCNTTADNLLLLGFTRERKLNAAGGVNFTMQKFGSTIQINVPRYKKSGSPW